MKTENAEALPVAGIGTRTKEWMGVKRLTIKRLSKKSGLSEGYLSDLISGKQDNPTLATLKKIAKGLGISLCCLMGGDCIAQPGELDGRATKSV
ncbi:MAG: helix-turn-helix domain-containing protein [Bacillota bacterium]